MNPQTKPPKKPNYRERVRLGLVKAKPRQRIKPVADRKKNALAQYSKWSKMILSSETQCQRCGNFAGLEAHHPHGRSKHNLFQIMCLCHTCHAWVHAYPNTSLAQGWLSPIYRGLIPDPEHTLAVKVFTYCTHRYTAKVGNDLEKDFHDLCDANAFVIEHMDKAQVSGVEMWSIRDNAIQFGEIIKQSGDLKQ